MANELMPARLFRPGELLKDELDARGWTQSDLAAVLDRPKQMVSEVIRGKKQITPETSIELGIALGTSPGFWHNLETIYQQRLAERNRASDSGIARRARLYDLLPLRDMIRREWLCASSSSEELETEVLRFLGLTSFEFPEHLAASFRCGGTEPYRYAQLAWLRRVEQVAATKRVSPYSPLILRDAIPNLLMLSRQVEDVARANDVLAEAGVRLVILRHLEKTYVDGAALWVDGQPVIALTLRYDRIDAFWFTLMHEVAHILSASESGQGNNPVVERLYTEDNTEAVESENISVFSDEEVEANTTAADWLIPPQLLCRFVTTTSPYFSGVKVRDFAASINRHPGIIVGRLQKDGRIPYKNLRSLLVKVSPHLRDVGISS